MKKNFFTFLGVLFLIGILFAVSASAETKGDYELVLPEVRDTYISGYDTMYFANYVYCHEQSIPEGETRFLWTLDGIVVSTDVTCIISSDSSGELRLAITPVAEDGSEGYTVHAEPLFINNYGTNPPVEPSSPLIEYFDKDTNEVITVTEEKTVSIFGKNVYSDILQSGTYGINFGGINFFGEADILPEKYWCVVLVDQDGTILLPGKIFEYYAFDGYGGKSDILEYIVE